MKIDFAHNTGYNRVSQLKGVYLDNDDDKLIRVSKSGTILLESEYFQIEKRSNAFYLGLWKLDSSDKKRLHWVNDAGKRWEWRNISSHTMSVSLTPTSRDDCNREKRIYRDASSVETTTLMPDSLGNDFTLFGATIAIFTCVILGFLSWVN